MDKVVALFSLLKYGQSVADPALWKQRQVNATMLAGVIMAVVNTLAVFGVAVPIDLTVANMAAGAIVSLVNVYLTYATTDKIGLPGTK